jgi:hypothetical protein
MNQDNIGPTIFAAVIVAVLLYWLVDGLKKTLVTGSSCPHCGSKEFDLYWAAGADICRGCGRVI